MVDPLTLDDGSLRGTTYTTRLARGYFGGYMPIIGSWDEIDVDMARPLQTDNYGRRPSSIGMRARSTFTSITRRALSSTSTRTTTRSRRASRSRAAGTLVDTRQVSQEFRCAGFAERASSTTRRGCISSTSRRTRRAQSQRRRCGRVLREQLGIRGAQRRRESRAAATVAARRARRPRSRTPRRTAWRCSAKSTGTSSDRATLTLGLRHTWEDKTSDIAEVGIVLRRFAAHADRQRYGRRDPRGAARQRVRRAAGRADQGQRVSWLVNPSFRLTDDVLLYASAAAGEKSGVGGSSTAADGLPANVDPEKLGELRGRASKRSCAIAGSC